MFDSKRWINFSAIVNQTDVLFLGQPVYTYICLYTYSAVDGLTLCLIRDSSLTLDDAFLRFSSILTLMQIFIIITAVCTMLIPSILIFIGFYLVFFWSHSVFENFILVIHLVWDKSIMFYLIIKLFFDSLQFLSA